jgi:Ribosomal protein S36, mitochondrial
VGYILRKTKFFFRQIANYVVGVVESHDLKPHPQAPKDLLPTPVTDFKRYRANAQQHGPLARSGHFPSRRTNENNSESGGVVMDRDDLPARFRRMVLTTEEMEAIEVFSCYLGNMANDLEWRSYVDMVNLDDCV